MESKIQITTKIDSVVLAKAVWRITQLTGITPSSLSQIVKLSLLKHAHEADEYYQDKERKPSFFDDSSQSEIFINASINMKNVFDENKEQA